MKGLHTKGVVSSINCITLMVIHVTLIKGNYLIH